MLNERRRQALEADLAVLVTQVTDPRTAHLPKDDQTKTTAVHAAEIYLQDYCALGFPAGGGNGRSVKGDHADPSYGALGKLVLEHNGPVARDVNLPGYDKDRVDLDHALKMMELHASRAAAIVGRMRVVGALDDPPNSPCNVLECSNVPERLVKPKGSDIAVCGRCRKHFERHGRHWPKDRNGRDVRSTAA